MHYSLLLSSLDSKGASSADELEHVFYADVSFLLALRPPSVSFSTRLSPM